MNGMSEKDCSEVPAGAPLPPLPATCINHTTLPQIMEAEAHDHIDILKIDIEGAERIVLPMLAASGVLSRVGQVQSRHRHVLAASQHTPAFATSLV